MLPLAATTLARQHDGIIDVYQDGTMRLASDLAGFYAMTV